LTCAERCAWRAGPRRDTTSTVEGDQDKDQSADGIWVAGTGRGDATGDPIAPAGSKRAEGAANTQPDAGRRRRGWFAVVLIATFVGGGSALGAGLGVKTVIADESTALVGFSPNTSVFRRMSDVQSVLKKVLPSVVTIQAEGIGCAAGTQGGEVEIEDGTGMILTASGEILTNNHVVANATEISVTLYGQRTPYPATLVGTDPTFDVALLQLHRAGSLRAVSLGESARTEVGEDVLAIGNALALSESTPSATEGIISARQRSIRAGGDNCPGTESLTGLLQTQAAINSGNSGGPLVNAQGQVIGMNTAAASTSPGDARTQNIGFAIPIASIQALLPGLRRGGTAGALRAFLGVEVVTVTRTNGLGQTSGAEVVSLFPGSPAALAGIRVGDVIVGFAGHYITSALSLTLAVRDARPAERVSVELYRGAKLAKTSLVLTTKPAPEPGTA